MQRASLSETFPLHIQLLGSLHVMVGERVVADADWMRRPARSIVKLLALEPGHRLHRDVILERLWPDMDPEAALNTFHKALHAARRALEPGLQAGTLSSYLLTDGEIINLRSAAGLWIDVEVFEAAAAAALREQSDYFYTIAINSYTGDLLPEDRYEDWAIQRREELQTRFLEVLRGIAELEVQRGNYAAATQHLRRALTIDPLAEDVHVSLMRVYALSGSRHQSLRQYALLRETLGRELDAEPDPATIRLYHAIAAGHLPSQELRSVVHLNGPEQTR